MHYKKQCPLGSASCNGRWIVFVNIIMNTKSNKIIIGYKQYNAQQKIQIKSFSYLYEIITKRLSVGFILISRGGEVITYRFDNGSFSIILR